MKKVFLLIAMITLSVVSTNAQVSFGIKAGLNGAYVTNLNTSSSSAGSATMTNKSTIKLGGQFGVYANIHFGKLLGFQPEVLFSMKGYKHVYDQKYGTTESKTTTNLNLNYIEIPLQLRVNPTKSFFILAGPYFGILASSSSTSTVDNTSSIGSTSTTSKGTPSGIQTIDFGMALGLGLKAENGFTMGLKYSRGFTSISSNSTNVNSVFQLFVGFEFGGKR